MDYKITEEIIRIGPDAVIEEIYREIQGKLSREFIYETLFLVELNFEKNLIGLKADLFRIKLMGGNHRNVKMTVQVANPGFFEFKKGHVIEFTEDWDTFFTWCISIYGNTDKACKANIYRVLIKFIEANRWVDLQIIVPGRFTL